MSDIQRILVCGDIAIAVRNAPQSPSDSPLTTTERVLHAQADEIERLRKPLEWIKRHYANQDMGHEAFRVEAAILTDAALAESSPDKQDRLGDGIAAAPMMALPAGKTCGDCRHWQRCSALIQTLDPALTTCDFSPSRFSPQAA